MHMQFLKSLVMFVPVRYKYDASIAICLYTCRNLLVLINTKLTDLWFMFFCGNSLDITSAFVYH